MSDLIQIATVGRMTAPLGSSRDQIVYLSPYSREGRRCRKCGSFRKALQSCGRCLMRLIKKQIAREIAEGRLKPVNPSEAR